MENNDISKLILLVRKFQKYQGDIINTNPTPYESIDKWVETCKIEPGTKAVKGFVLHRSYKHWAEDVGYEIDYIAKTKNFNSVMKNLLTYKITKKNLFFYTKEKIKYDPKKEKGQAAAKT